VTTPELSTEGPDTGHSPSVESTPDGSDTVAHRRMRDTGGQSDPARHDSEAPTLDRCCPVCGSLVTAIQIAGPDERHAAPCGHWLPVSRLVDLPRTAEVCA
jgi:hypothetical protein